MLARIRIEICQPAVHLVARQIAGEQRRVAQLLEARVQGPPTPMIAQSSGAA